MASHRGRVEPLRSVPAADRSPRRLPIALLAIVLIVPQAYAGIATNVAREVTDEIVPLVPETVGAWRPPQAGDRGESGAFDLPSASPTASPSPTPTVPRQNILLIGVDPGIGRNTFLTDTMIVMSLDPVAETVSMISIPRDMVDVPLPDGRSYRGKINGLLSFARHHPKEFPGSDGRPRRAHGRARHAAQHPDRPLRPGQPRRVRRVIDTLGGINVDVDDGFCDPTYDEYGFSRGFAISPGRHHLNGEQALAYARVRKAAGESDFTRAARQQEVLSGIRDRIKGGGFLGDPIGLLRALGKTVVTNVPRDIVPGVADVASRVGRGSTYRAVVTHPLVRSGYDKRGSIQLPDIDGIRRCPRRCSPPPASCRLRSTACRSRRVACPVPASAAAPRGQPRATEAEADPETDREAGPDRGTAPDRAVAAHADPAAGAHAAAHSRPDPAAYSRPDADSRWQRRGASAVARQPAYDAGQSSRWDQSSTSTTLTTPTTPTSSSAPSTATSRSR